MFNFNLKPGHANSADGLLDAVGAFDVTGQLVAGHTNSADGLLVAQYHFLAPVSAGGPEEAVTGTGALTESVSIIAANGTLQFIGTAALVEASGTLAASGTVASTAITGTASLTETASTLTAEGEVYVVRVFSGFGKPYRFAQPASISGSASLTSAPTSLNAQATQTPPAIWGTADIRSRGPEFRFNGSVNYDELETAVLLTLL